MPGEVLIWKIEIIINTGHYSSSTNISLKIENKCHKIPIFI